MAEAVGEEAARKAWAAYGRGGCCDEHLEDGRWDDGKWLSGSVAIMFGRSKWGPPSG